MPYIPHTTEDVATMLRAIGANSIEDLFDEIPAHLKTGALDAIPAALSELEVARLMTQRAAADAGALNFIGAGAYEHYIPAPVWAIATRGEFYSAYTPYQAEASQGTLQLIYEYQSMMAELTGMDVSNASLYDGASALAESCLMAVRANRNVDSLRILVPRTVNPTYLQVARSIAGNQELSFDTVDYDRRRGVITLEALEAKLGENTAAPSAAVVDIATPGVATPGVATPDVPAPGIAARGAPVSRAAAPDIAAPGAAALVIQQPNFFGNLEDVGALTDWAHARGMLVIAVVNPTSLALLEPPGRWGAAGADIVCGEGQPLGCPLSGGGPYFGFMTTRQAHVRQMPGRIVGRTVDVSGRPGFTLTLQAREQHIRRGKATSNICTNQGLLVTAASVYLSLMGAAGLERVADACLQANHALTQVLCAIPGVRLAFDAPRFHESVLLLDRPVAPVLARLAQRGVLGGWDLSAQYPELGPALLVCATETKSAEDLARFAAELRGVLETDR